MDGGRSPPVDWRATVAVRWDSALRDELLDRHTGEAALRSVTVTDLLDPRRAFFRTVAELPPPPERRLRQERGRSLHGLVGGVLAAPRYLEVRVRRDGIVGQVDLLEDEPTELKTTESLPPVDRIAETRPAYVDQLAMYCALVDRSTGRLVIVRTAEGVPTEGVVLRARFTDLPSVLEEMRRRARRLREALSEGDGHRLPRCAWFDRGCEFQAAGVCPCTGREDVDLPLAAGRVAELGKDAAWSQLVSDRVRSLDDADAPLTARAFRDLAYPRRAFFERRSPLPPGEEPFAPSTGRRDLFRALVDLLETGPTGEVTRQMAPGGVPPEPVSCFRGRPYLLKVTRAYPPPRATDLIERQSHYFLELGLRAAAVGAFSGWIFLGYERADHWKDRLAVLDVRFDPPDAIRSLAQDRERGLERALGSGEFRDLPPCPRWMADGCPYRERCGCGTEPGATPNR